MLATQSFMLAIKLRKFVLLCWNVKQQLGDFKAGHDLCTILVVLLVADDNKEMAGMLTDYPDILGFLRIHKLASINTQVDGYNSVVSSFASSG